MEKIAAIKLIIKKYIRDIPIGIFLIMGLNLTFFLIINSIYITNSITQEEKTRNFEQYKFNKSILVKRLSESTNDSVESYLGEVGDIASLFCGNVSLGATVYGEDNESFGTMTLMSIKEEIILELENDTR